MAQSACGPDWSIPTLEDTYDFLVDHSTWILRFLQPQMADGHLLQDPWDEACTLRNAVFRDAHLFVCLMAIRAKPGEFRKPTRMGVHRPYGRKDEIEGS